MNEDELLAQALWAAEQADLYGAAYGSEAADSDSDYDCGGGGSSSRKRRKQASASRSRTKAPRSKSGAARAVYEGPHTAPAAQPAAPDPGTSSDVQQPAAGDSAAAPAAAAAQPEEGGAAAVAAADGSGAEGGRRKRKDCGQKREKGRAWSAAEAEAFAAGLQQHGRDWKAIAAAIGSRDARAVASHAQKHFIKLCLTGTPLPAKVIESGCGYTLSGKLLDPHSAAAAAYGFSMAALQVLEGEALATALSGVMPPDAAAGSDSGATRDQQAQEAHQQGGLPPRPTKPRSQHARSRAGGSSSSSQAAPAAAAAAAPQPPASDEELLSAVMAALPPPPLAASELNAAAAAPPPPPAAAGAGAGVAGDMSAAAAAAAAQGAGAVGDEQVPGGAAAHAAAAAGGADAGGPTAYARSRPRRGATGSRRVELGDTSESLALVPCSHFAAAPPGSGLPGAQPYAVSVDLRAMLLMEVHAHLSSCEVIGLLGGTWDPSQRQLSIHDAYPCRRAAGSADATSVELDPAAEVEARHSLAAAGQRCVGWYHSHPVFEPQPSIKDMDAQRNYQALTRDDDSSGGAGADAGSSSSSSGGSGAVAAEPFLGFILSPYDPALRLPHTAITAFVVQQRGTASSSQLVPYRVQYGMAACRALPDMAEPLRALLAATAHDVGRTHFAAPWRPFTVLGAGGRLLGGPLTKLDKLLAGLRWQCCHVQSPGAVAAWLDGLVDELQAQWVVPLRHQPATAAVVQEQAPSGVEQQVCAEQQEQQQQQQQQTIAVADAAPEDVAAETIGADGAGAV